MANILPTPSIIAIKPFDATLDKNIEFIYTGSQAVSNKLVIVDNESDSTTPVYEKEIIGSKLAHTIPKNTLVNGKQYIAQVQVSNVNNDKSELSDPVLFYCYSTPEFSIGDIEDPYMSANIEVKVAYYQAEGEALKSYQYILYDRNKIAVSSSNMLYSMGVSHTFFGLVNGESYFVRCIGETTHGITLDTGYKSLTIVYNTIPANILFQLENHRCQGYISIDTNIITIGYELENDNYKLENGAVTLWDNSLTYNDGFSVDGDFVLYVDAKKLPVKTFLKAKDGDFTLSIMNICGQYYCEFKHDSYVIYKPLPKAQVTTIDGNILVDNNGNKIEIINASYEDDEFVIFELKRVNNLYSLNVYYKSDGL